MKEESGCLFSDFLHARPANMVEHKRLVSRVKRQRKSLSSSYRDERRVEPIPNRASSQIRVLGTLLMLFCLRGLRTVCPSFFLTAKRKVNLKSRICVLLAVFVPLVLFSVTARAQSSGDLQLCDIDVVDSCQKITSGSSDGTVRGRLEVYYNDGTDTEWRGICDDYYTDDDATVACRKLGSQSDYTIVHPEFGRTLRRLTGPSLIDPNGRNTRENNKFWLDDLLCHGNEDELIGMDGCPRAGDTAIGEHNCRKDEHAGAVCYKSVVCRCAEEA